MQSDPEDKRGRKNAMLKIAVCDDEQIAVKIIFSALKKEFHNQKVDCKFDLFTSSNELTARLTALSEKRIFSRSFPHWFQIFVWNYAIGITGKFHFNAVLPLYCCSRKKLFM